MTSAIKDNRSRGKVGDFLKECIIPALEAEIDRLVYALYGLTDEEIAVVEQKP